MGRAQAAVALALALVSCGDEICEIGLSSDAECASDADCADALSCLDGRCRLLCERDIDCRVEESPSSCVVAPELQRAVCQAGRCVAGCPDRACPLGQAACQDGRCGHFFESFEGDGGDAPPTLSGLGWSAGANRRTEIRTDCGELCGAEDPAGPAASGQRFVLLGTTGTPEKGTPLTAPTCRACACCLDCILEPPALTLDVLDCPRGPPTPRLRCGPAVSCGEPVPPEVVPAECGDVCAACDACEARSEVPPGRLLTACEQRAASRVCGPCARCDDAACLACRERSCAAECTAPGADPSSAACEACEQAARCPCEDCRDCGVCREAEACTQGDRCGELRRRCRALGADGCFPTPVDYPELELDDAGQALASPVIDLASAEGRVLVEFAYVPFNIGSVYAVSEQGVSSCDWQEAPQRVRLQMCGGGCDAASAWVDVPFVSFDALPREAERANGLRVLGQSAVDWEIGRARAEVPAPLRTAQFRFRLLPELSEFARLGVDDVVVRSVAP